MADWHHGSFKAARVLEENQIEVAKIQLKDIARTWWLAVEARLDKPITLDQFSKIFHERFFPATAKKETKNNLSDSSNGTDLSMNMLLSS